MNYCQDCGCEEDAHLKRGAFKTGKHPCGGVQVRAGRNVLCECKNLRAYPLNSAGMPYEP